MVDKENLYEDVMNKMFMIHHANDEYSDIQSNKEQIQKLNQEVEQLQKKLNSINYYQDYRASHKTKFDNLASLSSLRLRSYKWALQNIQNDEFTEIAFILMNYMNGNNLFKDLETYENNKKKGNFSRFSINDCWKIWALRKNEKCNIVAQYFNTTTKTVRDSIERIGKLYGLNYKEMMSDDFFGASISDIIYENLKDKP